MSESNLPKTYNPESTESKIHEMWEKGGFFKAEIDKKKKPFSIMMPPANITGRLHLGHALTMTIEDILVRFNRMRGKSTLWLPGVDHAGIATQNVVEKELAKEGESRSDLGREEFEMVVWAWKEKYGSIILKQIRKLGASCDWSRERFTLDEEYQNSVTKAFVYLYDKGLIYKGDRIINWCPRCGTAISDLEVEYEEERGKLWHLRYPLKIKNQKSLPRRQAGKIKNNYIVVATTRPETMLGDTAIAVNPKDRRYKNLIGKKVILPIVKREIPIISDQAVDPKFGTGAVKVTPAHDRVDFEIGKRHKLPSVQVIGEDGRMTKEAGGYKNLKIDEARRKIVERLKKEKLLEKIEDYSHSVGHCSRCKTIIESLISKQWFVKTKPLAKRAIEVVKKNKIKIIPKRFTKIYFNWLENIQDWCISRQLWWGHRIPVWYCSNCKSQMAYRKSQENARRLAISDKQDGVVVSEKKPSRCPYCGNTRLVQDPDVLDTWFSSSLWPFATLGWPEGNAKCKMQNEKLADLDYFYPTDVLETGYDILFFWVARMVMMGLEFMNEIPFRNVFLHGLIRDRKGRKMSKSEGNVIDPVGLIKKYGADALRLSLIMGSAPGSDISVSEDKVRGTRNFCNKIWNASRFVLITTNARVNAKEYRLQKTKEDRWILKELEDVTKKVTHEIENYRIGQAAESLYHFFWHKFCDKYIETTKKRLYGHDLKAKYTAQYVLLSVLKKSLILLHPFIPFITEDIWQKLPKEKSEKKMLIIEKWAGTDN